MHFVRRLKNRFRSRFRKPEANEQFAETSDVYELSKLNEDSKFKRKTPSSTPSSSSYVVDEIVAESQWSPNVLNSISNEDKDTGQKRKGFWRLVKTKPLPKLNDTNSSGSKDLLLNRNFELQDDDVVLTTAQSVEEAIKRIDNGTDLIPEVEVEVVSESKKHVDGSQKPTNMRAIYSKKMSRAMEICYRGRCVKSSI